MNKVWDDLPPELRDNPFFQFSEKTNYVPAWDRIKPEHIMPAMDYALDLMRRNVGKITENKSAPNFKNTVEALEQAGELSSYFLGVLFNLMPGTGPAEDEYDRIVNDVQRKYGQAYGEIYRDNTKLYSCVLEVAKNPAYKNFSTEKKMLMAMYVNTFTDEGVKLNAKKKAAVRELTDKITDLEYKSMNNMKMAGRSFVLAVDDREKLKGLSEFMIAAAAQKAEAAGHPGQWAFGLGTDTYVSFMQSAENRELRRQMWHAHETQASSGPYDNRSTILELVRLQQQRTRLLGYRSIAAYNISYNMAVEPKRVSKFLSELRKKAMPAAKRETKQLQKFAKEKDGVTLEPWDVHFYREQMKKNVLGYDEEQLRPYLELENVLKGVFRHYEKLLGVRFEETKEYPVYHPDVRAFKVFKKGTDKAAGVVFMDLLARDGKPPGTAWDADILSQGLFEGKNRRPIDMIVTKFAKGEPTLLTHYDLLVLLHEIGHATNNLVSKCCYASLSGTSVDGDFVEFASQFEENYGFELEFLDDVAVHHQTGERMPDELKQKIKDSLKFMAGSQIIECVMKGWLDLSWYRADTDKITSVEAFEKAALAPYRLLPHYDSLLSPHFSHLFGGGYEANFYSYDWSKIMEADAFAAFAEKGLYNRGLAASYKKILEKGGSEWPSKLFQDFRGRPPVQKHFLARAGLLGATFNYAASPDSAAQAPVATADTAAPVVVTLAGATPAVDVSPAPGTINVQASANDNIGDKDIDDLFSMPRKPRPGPHHPHRYML